MAKRTRKQLIEDAAEARTDLTILHGVIALLEGGTISVMCNDFVQPIIVLCRAGAQERLDAYDEAVAAARK
jgi:hypothetical protein